MAHKKTVQKISDAGMAIVVMMFLVSASLTAVIAFKPLYYFDIAYLHIPETSGYSEQEIRVNYKALIDYNLSPAQDVLQFPTLPMSREGRIHFREVKRIFWFFIRMFAVTAVLLTAGALWKRRRREYGYLRIAGTATPVLAAALGAAIAINWERVFVLFHEWIFQNDYWLFDPVTDPVIMILPETFFLHCAVMMLLLIAVGCAACIGLWRLAKAGNRE